MMADPAPLPAGHPFPAYAFFGGLDGQVHRVPVENGPYIRAEHVVRLIEHLVDARRYLAQGKTGAAAAALEAGNKYLAQSAYPE